MQPHWSKNRCVAAKGRVQTESLAAVRSFFTPSHIACGISGPEPLLRDRLNAEESVGLSESAQFRQWRGINSGRICPPCELAMTYS